MKLSKLIGVLALHIFLLAACATSPNAPEEKKQERPVSRAVPHTLIENIRNEQEKDAAAAAQAKAAKGEKAKLYPGTGVFIKPPTVTATPTTPSGDEVVLNFEGADIREVAKTIITDILRETYIIDPRVQGTVNLHTSKPIPRSALLATLETVLRMNGAAVIREEGIYKIVPSAAAPRGSVTPQLGSATVPLPSGYSIQIIPLQFIAAKEMAKILEPYAPEPGAVRVDELRNLIILAGSERERKHMLETIQIFDVDWLAGMSVGLFTLQSADVKTVYPELEKIFGDKAQGPLAGVIRLVPIERLNGILVITPQPKYLEQAQIWLERLDKSGGTGAGRLYVYPVQNGNAEKLAALLNQLFSGKKTTTRTTPPPGLAPGTTPAEIRGVTLQPPGAPLPPPQAAATAASGDGVALPTDVTVIADKDNNALLILASASDYEKIETALRKLDVVPRQVLIEVTIAEVTLTDNLSLGLEWLFNRYGNTGTLDMGAVGLAPLVPGFSLVRKINGETRGVLNILGEDANVNVISSPHVMVHDNQTAKIQVGSRVPTLSSTQSLAGTTTGIINSVQYLETGVLLSVTPHINAGGLVTMEIQQEVSDATATRTSGIDSPTIRKRAAQTTVTVQNGETIVLGGMIKDDRSFNSSGIPLLSQIPLVGALFGSQSVVDSRTELVLFITPKVASNNQQARQITEEFRKKVPRIEELLPRTQKPDDKSQYPWQN